MNRILAICLGILLVVPVCIKAQVFTVARDSAFINGRSSDFSFFTKIQIENLTGFELNLRWVLLHEDIPSGWEIGICDNQICHPYGTDSADFKALPPGSKDYIKVYFYPNYSDGKGEVKILLYSPDDERSNGDTVRFYGETWATGIDDPKDSHAFSFYPNPASDYLNIQFSRKGNHRMELFNVLGKKLKVKLAEGQDKTRISLKGLPEGMYVINYRDPSGKIHTRTFSKQ